MKRGTVHSPRSKLHLPTPNIKNYHNIIHKRITQRVRSIRNPVVCASRASSPSRPIINDHILLINWKDDAANFDCEPGSYGVAGYGVLPDCGIENCWWVEFCGNGIGHYGWEVDLGGAGVELAILY